MYIHICCQRLGTKFFFPFLFPLFSASSVCVFSSFSFFSPCFSFMKPSPATFVLPLCFFSFFLIQSFSDNFVRFLSRSFLTLIFLMLPSPLLFSFFFYFSFFSYSFFPSRFSHEVVFFMRKSRIYKHIYCIEVSPATFDSLLVGISSHNKNHNLSVCTYICMYVHTFTYMYMYV